MIEKRDEATAKTVPRPMAVLVSGASGFIGRAAIVHLRAVGHAVIRLVRRDARAPDEISWDPMLGSIGFPRNALFDAVVHLAGENIADGRWTKARKQAIRDSRTISTRGLIAALRQLPRFPQVFVSAGAIGYYGHRGDEVLTEESSSGQGFLPEVCRAWEQESGAAAACGARVVTLRFGPVLGADGGMLARMLPVFRAGLGGKLGDGQQWISWIARQDVVAIIGRALVDRQMAGPVNAVAPAPVRNEDFTKILARLLHRPAICSLPSLVLRTLFGEMAELLLDSTRVMPARLESLNHVFLWPELEPALRWELGAILPVEPDER